MRGGALERGRWCQEGLLLPARKPQDFSASARTASSTLALHGPHFAGKYSFTILINKLLTMTVAGGGWGLGRSKLLKNWSSARGGRLTSLDASFALCFAF